MKLLKKICPICVVVSSTWITLLTLRYLGYNVSESLIAMLMGGSVVGISYVLSKRLSGAVKIALWKLISIPIGFVAAWALLHFAWGYFILGVSAYLAVWIVVKIDKTSKLSSRTVETKKELENCC